MVVAAVAPHFDALAVLSLLLCSVVGEAGRVEDFLVADFLHRSAQILPEDAHIRHFVLYPHALVNFAKGLRRSENSNATCLAVEPEAFEVASIGPDELSIAALRVVIADYLLAILGRCGFLYVASGLLLRSAVDRITVLWLNCSVHLERADLTHVFESSELYRSKLKLAVLNAEPLVLALRFDRLAEESESYFRVWTYLSA